jgi:hypothetical protein
MKRPASTTSAPETAPIESLRPAPENAILYDAFDLRNPDDAALVASVKERGILVPITADQNGVILDGHRRYAAAVAAEVDHVPLRRKNIIFASLSASEKVRLLASYNVQRRKSAEESTREQFALVNPIDAWRELRERLALREQTAHRPLADAMRISGSVHRKEISEAKRPFHDATLAVIDGLRNFWPVSVRQVHYGLLNAPPLVHASKRRSRYRNDRASYTALVDLCARSRLAGIIPWAAIADETRPVELWGAHPDAAAYSASEAQWFLGCYRRDLMQCQPRHVEIVCEKNTVGPIVRKVADDFTIPVTSARGFCSLEPRRRIAERMLASGKGNHVLLLVSDCDPDGMEIAESLVRSLRDDFNVEHVVGVRAALTIEQARAFGLPENCDAKPSSPRYAKFVAQQGCRSSFELEAVPPEELMRLVRAAILGVIDEAAYAREVETWKQEAAGLAAVRARVLAAIGGGTTP